MLWVAFSKGSMIRFAWAGGQESQAEGMGAWHGNCQAGGLRRESFCEDLRQEVLRWSD